ncbi:MAG: cell division protein FtsZ [Gammaproteobacteria bacterium]|jgi:cell division protein FtsZ|nr:cell division protein FtsZ [Gammaproteobacteria bacterium]
MKLLLGSTSFISSIFSLDAPARLKQENTGEKLNHLGIKPELGTVPPEIKLEALTQNAVIKVIGIGGGGNNAVKHMIESGIEGIEFVCIDTDLRAPTKTSAKKAFRIGPNFTRNSGSREDGEVSRQSSIVDREQIQEAISGTDMLFIIAGMGGETGTGAAPVVAQIAKEMDILTIAVVTNPFNSEGSRCTDLAEQGIKDVSTHIDSIITIPNEKLMLPENGATSVKAFNKSNELLAITVKDIAEVITRPGVIGIDYADVRTVMADMGMAIMGTSKATGKNRAKEAALAAITSPFLDNINIANAKGVLVTVTAGRDLSIDELDEVASTISEVASDEAIIVVGAPIDPAITPGELRVTLVATGLDNEVRAKIESSLRKPKRAGQIDYSPLDKPVES